MHSELDGVGQRQSAATLLHSRARHSKQLTLERVEPFRRNVKKRVQWY